MLTRCCERLLEGSKWKRIEIPQQLMLMFGANLNILISSVTLYGRAENNLQKSFITRPKQLQGFAGFKTEIQVRSVFVGRCIFWNNFGLECFNFAFVYSSRAKRGGSWGARDPPLQAIFKQTTYNIPWRKRHDDNV